MSVTLIMFFGVNGAGLEATRSGDSNDVLSVKKKKKLFYAIVDGRVHSSHGGLLGRGVVILFSYATKLIRLSVKMSIIRHKLVIIKTLPLTFGIVI